MGVKNGLREINTHRAKTNSSLNLSSQQGRWVSPWLACCPPPTTSHTEAWKCHFQASAARRYPTWLCLSQRRRATSRRKKVKTRLSRACTILFCAMSAVSDKSPGKLVLSVFSSSPFQMCLIQRAGEQPERRQHNGRRGRANRCYGRTEQHCGPLGLVVAGL